MDNKKWYLSKTLWFNVVGAGIVALQSPYVHAIPGIDPEFLASVLAIGNFVLRLGTTQTLTK